MVGRTPALPGWPWCRVRAASLLLCLLSVATGIVWLIFSDNATAGWMLQDLLGVAFT